MRTYESGTTQSKQPTPAMASRPMEQKEDHQSFAIQRAVSTHPVLKLQQMYGNHYVQRVVALMANAHSNEQVMSGVEQVIQRARGSGHPLDGRVRARMESAFGADFSGIRVHADTEADTLNRAVNARAFTNGQDIFFREGEFRPHSSDGTWLLAHELTHVLQQNSSMTRGKLTVSQPDDVYEREADQIADRVSKGGRAVDGIHTTETVRLTVGAPMMQRDLAIEPPAPERVAPPLTEAQIQAAIRYNAFRFKDPFSIAVVRDVVGIPRFPAVSDRDLALAVAQWQAEFNLTVDGQVGPATTRTLVRELRAEDQRPLARQLRADNFVTWSSVNGPTRNTCSAVAPGFQWDVDFNTSLRGGWLIQRLDNTWNVTTCAGAPYAGPGPTLQYWEAWWVDNTGDVRIPTSLTTPPTSAAPAIADDLWRRPAPPGTRGTWGMSARLYTTLTLPAGFAFGAVPDAVALPATTAAPNADDLGLVAASRRQGGRWDCCDPNPALHFHNAA